MKKSNHSVRGFSLIEIVVALGLIFVMGGFSVSWFVKMQKKSRLNAVASDVLGKIMTARTEALTGRLIGDTTLVPPSGPGEFTGWAAQEKSSSAGFRIMTATEFEVFIDDDNVAGGEQVIGQTDLEQDQSNNRIGFDSDSVGRTIRFDRNGTAQTTETFTLIDPDLNQAREISVSKVGQVRIIPKHIQ